MKIIRWLLSHLFLVLLIVTVIYGYMFWGNLAGENTPAGKALAYLSGEFVEVEEFINAVKAKQTQLSAEQSPAEQQQLPERNADSKQLTASSESNKTVAVKRSIEQQPVSISYSYNQMHVKQNSAGYIESQAETLPQTEEAADSEPHISQPGMKHRPMAEPVFTPRQEETAENDLQSLKKTSPPAIAGTADAQDKFVPAKVEQQLEHVDKNGNVMNRSSQGDAIRESWVTARKSFYQRKYELSEQSYQDVIDNTTDNFDAYGELGNVYFNQGKTEQAATAYFEAASILVRKGQIRRAISLMGLLRHLDKNKANDLQKLIDSAVS